MGGREGKTGSYCRRNYLSEEIILLTSKSQEPGLNHTPSILTLAKPILSLLLCKLDGEGVPLGDKGVEVGLHGVVLALWPNLFFPQSNACTHNSKSL